LGLLPGGAIGVAAEQHSTYWFVGESPLVGDIRRSRPLPAQPAGNQVL
jgi:hypothetical protein